jgi:hypothetical protein
VPAQETAETASENLPSNQAITEEVSSHMPENSHSSENKATVTAQETAQQGYANLTSQEAKGEEALSQTHSEGTRYPKSSDRLWDKNSRLDVLGQQLGKLQASKESWLNKTEADFVLHSLIKREKRRARRTTFLSSVGLVLLAATAWALNEQRNTLIEEIRTSRQSAEANLQANRDLEALTDILRAEKTFDNPLLWFGNLTTRAITSPRTLYSDSYATKNVIEFNWIEEQLQHSAQPTKLLDDRRKSCTIRPFNTPTKKQLQQFPADVVCFELWHYT